MKILQKLKILGAVLGLTLMCSASKATITIQTNSWTNSFPIGTNTTYFTGGTMAGTAWWFGSWPMCTNLMTNDPSHDAQNNSSSGSLYLSIPFTANGQQGWFFSTFQDSWGYGDGGVQIPLAYIKQVAFDIYVKSGTPLSSAGNLGSLQANLIMGTASGGFASPPVASNFTLLTIPSTADGAWVHIVDSNTVADVALDIAGGYTNAAAIAIWLNNDNALNYPSNMTYTCWFDNLAVTTGTPLIAVTVKAGTAGCSFSVDGTNYTTTQVFNWIEGSGHTIATTSPQSGGTGIQYVWSSWSDSGAMSHTVNPTSATTYTANFTTQYYLTMDAGTGGSASPSSAWENSGAVVPISATANGGYGFAGWLGSGNGYYTGPHRSSSVTMNAPITETAYFTPTISVTTQTTSWTNTFPSGTNTTYFTGGTMAGTAWWFGSWPQCNEAMTNDPNMDAPGGSGGSLYLSIPFTATGQQGWFFSSFQDSWNWNDGGVQIPLADIQQLAFDIYVQSGTPLSSSGNLGWMEINLIMGTPSGGFYAAPIPATFTSIPISASADGAWVHIEDSNTVSDVALDIAAGYTNAAAIAVWFANDNADNYPASGHTYTCYIDNLAVTTSASSSPPVAQFTMSTNIGVAPFAVTFTDTSLHSPTSWNWSFGDGGTSTSQNPSHTFTNMWRQTVTLKVSNAYGSSTNSQAVYQCFPCDALYTWTGGTQGHVITIPTMSNSLAAGANTIGYFTLSNVDLPSSNVLGIIFTNLPSMTNSCPVVFSNGVIDANFSATNGLAFSWTNNHEEYMFHLNSSIVATNIVILYYGSMPLVVTNAGDNQYADELGISTVVENPIMGAVILNRNMAQAGPLPGYTNNDYGFEVCNPTVSGLVPPGFFPTNAWFNGNVTYEIPNKLYRILIEDNTNGKCLLTIGDPVTSTCMGFVTNQNFYTPGHLFSAYSDGHISGENFYCPTTSILTCHTIISLNRPISWQQATNIVSFGP